MPTLLCVCLPPDDEVFRTDVQAIVDAAGPNAHVSAGGLETVVALLQQAYPEVGVEPVVLAAPQGGGARQIWWYVHRDGRPTRLA